MQCFPDSSPWLELDSGDSSQQSLTELLATSTQWADGETDAMKRITIAKSKNVLFNSFIRKIIIDKKIYKINTKKEHPRPQEQLNHNTFVTIEIPLSLNNDLPVEPSGGLPTQRIWEDFYAVLLQACDEEIN